MQADSAVTLGHSVQSLPSSFTGQSRCASDQSEAEALSLTDGMKALCPKPSKCNFQRICTCA
jgi:hypothetical protein